MSMGRERARRLKEKPVKEKGGFSIIGLIGTFLDTFAKVAVIALVVMLTMRFAGEAYQFGYRLFTEAPVAEAPGVDIKVTIPMGANSRVIGRILEERGVIRDAKLFVVQELISDYRGKLASGTYVLNNSWTVDQIMAVMAGEDAETEETTPEAAASPEVSPSEEDRPEEAAPEETG